MKRIAEGLPKSPMDFFAFSFRHTFDDPFNGWDIYDPLKDYERIGFPDSQWRVTNVNANYEISQSYPPVLIVPSTVSDDELRKVAAFRSRGRIPVCVWKHSNGAAILRSSQPMVGLTRSRSSDDESLICQVIILLRSHSRSSQSIRIPKRNNYTFWIRVPK